MSTLGSTKLSDTLMLTECLDGMWLYDKTRGMNLAMRAETRDEAFVEALTYYQKLITIMENDHRNLKSKVSEFVACVTEEEE